MLTLASLPGCGSDGSSSPQSTAAPRFAWRLSGRGRRVSQAAKKHNANWLYASHDTADAHHAHPGDTSRIVRVEVSEAFHELVFTGRDAADLRRVL